MTRRRRNRLIRRTLLFIAVAGGGYAAWHYRAAWVPAVQSQAAELQRKFAVAPTSGPASRPIAANTPKRTTEKLWELRDRRAYSEMTAWIVPERARATTDLLAAVDIFLLAERQLRDHVRDNVGSGLRDAIDLSTFGEHLDIFSTNTELLDEIIAGDTAQVTYWVNGRLPRRVANFVRGAPDRWLYDPGPGDHPDLPRAFRALADGLRQTFLDLKSGRIDAGRVRAEPQYLAAELAERLAPGLRLFPRPNERTSP